MSEIINQKDSDYKLRQFKSEYIQELENSIFEKEVRGENKWHNQ
ncbi:MAG: hypothetical protein WC665_03490 [Sulfurimonas sp.]|jgi:hypothetical protein